MGWTVFYLERISPIICTNHKESDMGDIYILYFIVEEDNMRCKDEFKGSCPLNYLSGLSLS